MKLDELMGVKAHYDSSARDLLTKIKDKYDEAGAGAFAKVLTVGDTAVKFWTVDSGYEKFITYVEKHQNNPYLPKLKSNVKSLHVFFKRAERAPDKIKYIKLERLIKYEDLPKKRFFDTDLTYEDVFDNVMHKIKYKSEGTDDIKKHFVSELGLSSAEGIKELTELSKIAYDLHQLGLKLDLHTDNFMFRKEGDRYRPVYTDPVIQDMNEVDRGRMLKAAIMNPDSFADKVVSGPKRKTTKSET